MHTLILNLSILATIGLAAYMFRDKLEGFLPGWKLHITNGLIALGGVGVYLLTALGGLTTTDLINLGIDGSAAGAVITSIGIVNMLLSSLTKRAPAPVTPPTEYAPPPSQ